MNASHWEVHEADTYYWHVNVDSLVKVIFVRTLHSTVTIFPIYLLDTFLGGEHLETM